MRRVRGGALALGPQRYSERFGVQARAKERIAAKLASLVPESGAIGIDASSTLQRLATSITGARQLTVATNGLEAFNALRERASGATVPTGGQHDPRTDSLVGAARHPFGAGPGARPPLPVRRRADARRQRPRPRWRKRRRSWRWPG